jgi:hypothetical protein
VAAGIAAEIGCHTFRTTGTLLTSPMAAHESPRTTKLYDRTEGATYARRSGEDSAVNVFFAAAHLDDGERHRVFTRNRYLSGVLRTQCSKHYVRTRNRDVHLAEPPVGELKPGAAGREKLCEWSTSQTGKRAAPDYDGVAVWLPSEGITENAL